MHWYDINGNPVYEVPNKSGKKGAMRPTTLRDARKLQLLPSVTEILKVPDKPGLTRYFVKQAYDAMLSLKPIAGECDEDKVTRAKVIAKEHSETAMNLGTDIHDALESYFKGNGPKGYPTICKNVESLLLANFGEQEWVSEASFGHASGYGGKVDLHIPKAVIDYKTKEFDDTSKKLFYPEMGMQLAAYKKGLKVPEAKLFNIFISTTSDLVTLVEHVDYERSIAGFYHLLNYWQWLKQYKPFAV